MTNRKRLVFDVEGNGLLKTVDTIHCIVARDPDTRETLTVRRNTVEDTVADGLALMEKADTLIGHNIVAFDVPALKKVYPTFKPKAQLKDTLVLLRVAAPDLKPNDLRLWKQNLLPGALIGSHSLEAWGYRVQRHKGDYAVTMEQKGLDPWASWNQEMEDYCVNDVDVTEILWNLIEGQEIPEMCSDLEHQIHAICAEMERNGFPFDIAAAEQLARQLESDAGELESDLITLVGTRFGPKKRKYIKPEFEVAVENPKTYSKPDSTVGEDGERTWWGEVTTYKRDTTRDDVFYPAGAPFCKAEWSTFNPTSRDQIVRYLIDEHGWKPTEFTDTGRPQIDDAILRKLAEDEIPEAAKFAELLFVTKLLGQVKTGPGSWMKNYDPVTKCVHPYTNTGGTVTGRCSHSSPNIAQVPGVLVNDTKNKDGTPNKKLLLPNGEFQPHCFDADGKLKKKAHLMGRAGEYGWECRSLFRVPDNWVQVGVDLSGIEFRMLAELTAPFDDGELIQVVLTGDIHQYNMDKTGIPSRDIVKRVLYGLLYGAGDVKLGLTANPTATISEAKRVGAALRAQLMQGLPALKKAIDLVQREADRGYLIGLDGRRLPVRSKHSALNTRLQSNAALVAKKWICLIREYAESEGFVYGWNDDGYYGDYVMLALIHDESQNATAPDIADTYSKLCIQAARDAGTFFKLKCPVDAEAKVGSSWASTH